MQLLVNAYMMRDVDDCIYIMRMVIMIMLIMICDDDYHLNCDLMLCGRKYLIMQMLLELFNVVGGDLLHCCCCCCVVALSCMSMHHKHLVVKGCEPLLRSNVRPE
jgi:hypothetical protein